jgi:hypothetical protein
MNNDLTNTEYQRALDTYKYKREQYYNNLLTNNATLNSSSTDYKAYMAANRKLYSAINQKLTNAPTPVEGGGSADDKIFMDKMKRYTMRLNDEHTRSESLLRKHGFLKGNMIVAQRYAEAERYKKYIWLTICAIILIISFKTMINPSGATDVFNTVLFSIIFFLIVNVTEHIGSSSIFLIWIILVSLLIIYNLKHILNRD